MTVVEQVDSVLTLEEAQHLVDRMTQHVAILDSHVKKAWNGRIWEPLGFASWNEFCEQTFGSKRIRLAREDRQALVASLANDGMSNVAISAATGVSRPTIIKDRERAQGVNSLHPVHSDQVFRNEHLIETEAPPSDDDAVHSATQPTEPDPSEWTAEPSPAPTTDDQFALVDADLDDEIVDAEIVEDVPPEPRKVTGTDGKSYTVTPKPLPSDEERRDAERKEAARQAAEGTCRTLGRFVLMFRESEANLDGLYGHYVDPTIASLPISAADIEGALQTLTRIHAIWKEQANA